MNYAGLDGLPPDTKVTLIFTGTVGYATSVGVGFDYFPALYFNCIAFRAEIDIERHFSDVTSFYNIAPTLSLGYDRICNKNLRWNVGGGCAVNFRTGNAVNKRIIWKFVSSNWAIYDRALFWLYSHLIGCTNTSIIAIVC